MKTIPKIAELLATPEKWTKGTLARDASGVLIAPRHPDAVCWCLQGAAVKVFLDSPMYQAAVSALYAATEEDGLGFFSFISLNDATATTHADVLRVARRADELIAERLAQEVAPSEPA